MDNFFTPIPTTTRAPSTSSPFSTSLVYYFPPHEGHLQFPHAFPLEQVGQHLAYPAYPFVIGAGQQPHDLLSKEQERRLVDAWTTKVARSKRKMARQRSLSSSKNPASWATSNQVYTRGLAVYGADDAEAQNSNIKRDTYTFFTPDKKRLRVLLKKELKNSDVGSLGRIVLPKREAEENLPTLSDKDGIQTVIRDVYSNQEWNVKYKYWSNNKSRMYVLENTVDFVRQNELVIGDSITLYEDECKNLYVTIKRGKRPVVEEEDDDHQQQPAYRRDQMMMNNRNHMMMSYNVCHNQYSTPYTYGNRDEEEASLALLIEQLRHKEELEANSLATLSIGSSGHHAASNYSHRQPLP
ncbi:B3 domain-containing transcription factor LEC2 [Carya illinoinensis]|uniref:TF-B3 domain-containing protein n=1 Tax=Carya illinoinensis TaxID=32201 RepID=A0A8T1PHS3_CARIL|nr:B3 domain-containing transcription factor LEC2 [Carya illinoinensis]KAG6641263.1 hypothetical protein CIPAW_09G061600 [Carya illinoinensis]